MKLTGKEAQKFLLDLAEVLLDENETVEFTTDIVAGYDVEMEARVENIHTGNYIVFAVSGAQVSISALHVVAIEETRDGISIDFDHGSMATLLVSERRKALIWSLLEEKGW